MEAVDGDENYDEAGGADERVGQDVVDVGEVEHLVHLVLAKTVRVEDQDFNQVETHGEKITEIGQRESSKIEEGDTFEAASTDEENIGDAAKDAEEDEDGANDSIGDALDQPLIVEACCLEEGLRVRLCHHLTLPTPEAGTNRVSLLLVAHPWDCMLGCKKGEQSNVSTHRNQPSVNALCSCPNYYTTSKNEAKNRKNMVLRSKKSI